PPGSFSPAATARSAKPRTPGTPPPAESPRDVAPSAAYANSRPLWASEQGVNKRRQRRAAEDHDRPDQEQHRHNRNQPPLLVVPEEVEDLADRSAGAGVGLLLELALLRHVTLHHQNCLKYRAGSALGSCGTQ